jgi:transposase
MDMIGKVKIHLRVHLSFSDIARRTGLSRNTVKERVKAPAEVEPRYRRDVLPGKLSAFEEALVQMLRSDARGPSMSGVRPERCTPNSRPCVVGVAIAGCDFIRAWRQGEGQAAATKAFVRQALELGEAFQIDWSEEGLVIGGVYHRPQVSHLKLCASRALWLVAYRSQGHEMLIDAHTCSFAALGGIARRCIYEHRRPPSTRSRRARAASSMPGSR